MKKIIMIVLVSLFVLPMLTVADEDIYYDIVVGHKSKEQYRKETEHHKQVWENACKILDQASKRIERSILSNEW